MLLCFITILREDGRLRCRGSSYLPYSSLGPSSLWLPGICPIPSLTRIRSLSAALFLPLALHCSVLPRSCPFCSWAAVFPGRVKVYHHHSLTGFDEGSTNTVVDTCEIAATSIRGTLASIVQLLVTLGIASGNSLFFLFRGVLCWNRPHSLGLCERLLCVPRDRSASRLLPCWAIALCSASYYLGSWSAVVTSLSAIAKGSLMQPEARLVSAYLQPRPRMKRMQ